MQVFTCFRNFVDKLDKIIDTLSAQAVTLERLTITVEEHVSRTNKLEDIVLPIQREFNYMKGAILFIGFLATLAAIYEALSLWKH